MSGHLDDAGQQPLNGGLGSVPNRVSVVDGQTAFHLQVVLHESAVSGIACPQIMDAPGPRAGQDRFYDPLAVLTRDLAV